MFGKSINLFSLMGFKVRIDFSWIIIAVLIVWSLSVGLFPFQYKDLPTSTYWLMGIVGALGLFCSIIVHEFSHSVVAKHFGMPMKGITLFIFGGVAEMGDEPPSPRAEFFMAGVGPLSSLAIAAIFYAVYAFGRDGGIPVPVNGVIGYLAMINTLLAGFNLLPAFPLDGGRMLRAILWGVKNNLRWATKVSSRIGSGFGIALIVLGLFSVLRGNFVGGMWWFLIGMFLRSAARNSYQQILIRRALEGESVQRFMHGDPVTVPPSLSLEDLVNDYVYKYHYKMYPVVDGDTLVGCATTREIQQVPREKWAMTQVRDIAPECSDNNTVSSHADPVDVLSQMQRAKASRLMVTEGDRLVGVISLKDMLNFLALKVELEPA
jgi:Zn-dependent protease/predicted transcriptional regulator